MKTIENELFWFVPLTLISTWSFGLIFMNEDIATSPLEPLVMLFPAIVVILLYLIKFKKPVFRKSDLGFRIGSWKYLIIAPIVLTIISVLSYFISWFLNPGLFMSHEKIVESLTKNHFYFGNVWSGICLIFLVNLFIGGILNLPIFIGEELGWRAFMTPRLIRLFNPKIAFLTGGAIWAVWHSVMICQGLNYPGHPVSGIFMMILLCVPLGIIIQYFYVKSNSVFVAAMAHAGLNKSAMSATFLIDKADYNTMLYGPTGITGIILFWIVAVFLYYRVNWKEVYSVQQPYLTLQESEKVIASQV